MRERKILFPGSFDPFTLGHHHIVERALALFDGVIVAIGSNAGKQPLFAPHERLRQIERLYAAEPRVTAILYDGLTADAVRESGACAILRGVRSIKDFEYERELAEANRRLMGVETLLLPGDAACAHLSSSLVRELLHYGKDVSELLPPGFSLAPQDE